MPTLSMRKIETPSGLLAVWIRDGEGQPILFWPSIFYDHRMYGELVSHLPNPVAIIDGPGHGRSGIRVEGLTGDVAARSALGIAETIFGEQSFTFAGTSWGALVALALAAHAPTALHAVALFNTPWSGREKPSFSDRLVVAGLRLIGNRDVFKIGVARSFFAEETFVLKPDVPSAFLDQSFGDMGNVSAVKHVLLDRYDLPQAAPESVKVPALVVSGAHDRMYPVAVARKMAARMPNARHVTVENAAHIIPAEAPEQAASLILSLIAKTADRRIAA